MCEGKKRKAPSVRSLTEGATYISIYLGIYLGRYSNTLPRVMSTPNGFGTHHRAEVHSHHHCRRV